MKVWCLQSVNLLLGNYFSDVYKFLCHVSQIGEVSGTVVKSSNFYVLISVGMEISLKTRNKSCVTTGTGLRNECF
jgi:hypothetical protein